MRRSTTLVTPPTQTALTTVAKIKAELTSASPSQALRIPDLIEEASSIITGHIERELARATVKDTFHGHYFRRMPLVLSRLPVTTLTSVVSAGSAQDLSTLDLDAGAAVLYMHGHDVAVTYDAGYLLPGQAGRDLPHAIERACIDVVLALWYRPSRGDPMIRSESIDGIGSTSYLDPAQGSAAAMPPTAVAALSRFMNYAV
jgi:hypothetical protein